MRADGVCARYASANRRQFVREDRPEPGATWWFACPLDLLRVDSPSRSTGMFTTSRIPTRRCSKRLCKLRGAFLSGRTVCGLRPQSATGKFALPVDRSFESYDAAVKAISEPMPPKSEQSTIDQGYLDAHFVYPIHSPKSVFTIRTTDCGRSRRDSASCRALHATQRAEPRFHDYRGERSCCAQPPLVPGGERFRSARRLSTSLAGWTICCSCSA